MMPTYDYICDACGHEFEAYESIKAESQRTCPACKEQKLRRKIGAGAAILFKGSGFYQTDYRSDSYKKGAKADKSPDSPAKTDSSKSDSSKNDSPKSETAKTESPKTDKSKASSSGSST
jgi:putative FmdB family regulatory protein